MKAHMKRGWRALGLGALALLLVATLAAGGCSPGPSLATPGPEEYRIYDGREGIQTQAEVINASRAVAIVEDPAYSDPVTMIVLVWAQRADIWRPYDHNAMFCQSSPRTTKVTASEPQNGFA